MNRLYYCTQCTDIKSGKIGDFFYDRDVYNETRKFSAISPVFDCLIEFYNYAKAIGYTHERGNGLKNEMIKT